MHPVSTVEGGFSGPFADRAAAGRALAARLSAFAHEDPVVIGLPRGGVVVAAEVACALQVPTEFIVVRKVAAPWNPELALGAAGEGGVLVRNEELLRIVGMDRAGFHAAAESAAAEVQAQARRLRDDRPPPAVEGRIVILVDDGVATGATAEAAVRVMKDRGAATVVLAVPVATPDAIAHLRETADEVVAVDAPPWLGSVGAWYRDFSQVTDDQVRRLLEPGP